MGIPKFVHYAMVAALLACAVTLFQSAHYMREKNVKIAELEAEVELLKGGTARPVSATL